MLTVLPSIEDVLETYRASIAKDHKARQRLASYESAIARPPGHTSGGWALPSGRWTREDSGRIRVVEPTIQQIARKLRPHIVCPEGFVLIDADFSSAHVWIAAYRSGDQRLLAALRQGRIYERVGESLGIDASKRTEATRDNRDEIKKSVLALLNGGDASTVAERLSVVVPAEHAAVLGQRLYMLWWEAYGTLREYRDRVIAAWQASPGATFRADDLAGGVRVIPTSEKGSRGWKTLLSAAWTAPEAAMLDHVLGGLPFTRSEVSCEVPLFDGLLVRAPETKAAQGKEELEQLMRDATQRVGMGDIGVDVRILGRSWGGQ